MGSSPASRDAGRAVDMKPLRRLVIFAVFVVLPCGDASAHDPSSWGGLFRSRDYGARWLPVNEGRFIGSALGVAVSPADTNHLLLATDSGLLRSRNGGRDWTTEAPTTLVGGVFAVAFDVDGVRAIASTARGLFCTDDGRTWRQAALPREALPARAIVPGVARGRVYLGGADGVWQSDDWGTSWTIEVDGMPEGAVSAIVVLSGSPEKVYAVAGGRLWVRIDGARSWALGETGMPAGRVDTVASDGKDSSRLWAVASEQLYVSDDRGTTWRSFGRPLPEPNTAVRGIAAAGSSPSIVLTTDRGLLRSVDAGRTWTLQEGMLPAHLEAGPLVRDPSDPTTLYAGFALTPYDELWRMAAEGRTMLGRLDLMTVAGGVAFLAMVALTAALTLRSLRRHYERPVVSFASSRTRPGDSAR
jgi:hypothetical protein